MRHHTTPFALLAASLLIGCTDLRALDLDESNRLTFEEEAYRLEDEVVGLRVTVNGTEWSTVSRLAPKAADCVTQEPDPAPCEDDDKDGLVDRWETLLLDRMRPVIVLHRDEPLLIDRTADVVSFGRVMVAEDGHVRVFITLAYSYDYGRCSVATHRGDVERVVLDMVFDDEDPRRVDVERVYTAGHEYTAFDGSEMFSREEFSQLQFETDRETGEPRWIVYASAGKHATYVSSDRCRSHASAVCVRESCPASYNGEQRRLLLDMYNAGEPDLPLPAAESHSRISVWGDEPFCWDKSYGTDTTRCAPPMKEKLVNDPFDSTQ